MKSYCFTVFTSGLAAFVLSIAQLSAEVDEAGYLEMTGNSPAISAYSYDLGVTRLIWDPSDAHFQAGTSLPSQSNAGTYSFAFGNYVMSTGNYAMAFGFVPAAVGDYSLAFGMLNEASGDHSFSFGRPDLYEIGGTTSEEHIASGDFSFVFGMEGHATGDYSVAMGFWPSALGTASVAMNAGNTATGDYSTAVGVNTTADSYASVTIGRYNKLQGTDLTDWESTDPLLVVGIGSGPSARDNALTVYKDGRIEIKPQGDVGMDQFGN